MDQHSIALVVMITVFLYLGYQGVPVAFSLTAGALVTTAFLTPISLPSIVAPRVNGSDCPVGGNASGPLDQ